MPNGRSGGFILDKADLKQMLRALQVSIAASNQRPSFARRSHRRAGVSSTGRGMSK
jgi:hypothetical protein